MNLYCETAAAARTANTPRTRTDPSPNDERCHDIDSDDDDEFNSALADDAYDDAYMYM